MACTCCEQAMRWLLVLLMLVGCAYPSPRPAAKTVQEVFSERWTGKSEDDVIVRYGKPTEIVPMSNGNHVDSYHFEVTSTLIGVFNQGRAIDTYCDRRFEIDKTTTKVVRAVITGSRCDPDR